MQLASALPALLVAGLVPCAAARQGPSVRATDLTAQVMIVDGVATTTLELTVTNDGARRAEAIWLLPLPPGAVADDFRMTVGGVEMTGDVLDADGARRVYENIVRRRRDPGLLEYVGRGCLRARIFPIPTRGEVRARVAYRHVLPEISGLRRWSLALAAAGIEGRAPESAVLDLTIRSRRPIRTTFSPNTAVHVGQDGEHGVRASFEGPPALLGGRELAVLYGLSEAEFGLDLMSTRVARDGQGTFLMLVAPRRDWSGVPLPGRSIAFVLDTSGSMSGEKMDQAKGALRFFVNSLRPQDRFDVVPFSTEAEPFFRRAVEPTAENRSLALQRIDALTARGGTYVAGALKRSLSIVGQAPERVPVLVFLTDGRPTVGLKDVDRLREAARRWNGSGARIFVFGVGDGVNTHLLDGLAEDSGGARHYVLPGEDIEVKTSDLLTKISHPVLTDLTLEVQGVELSKVAPARLPDLFQGSRLTIVGRYRGSGPAVVRLSGRMRGERREYVYEPTFADGPRPEFDFLPPLWAQRRVALLLDALRLNGDDPELRDEVRRLGTEYRIVTPYTSHLILEEGLRIGGGGGGTYRGVGDTRPSGPGTLGPATPGAPRRGFGGAASPGPVSSAGGPASPGPTRMASPPDLDEIAAALRDAGVLPRDAAPADLRRLAGEVARELRAADRALRGLGREAVGAQAVDDSVYLSRLLEHDAVATGSSDFFLGRGQTERRPLRLSRSILDRFTRRVKDKTFVLRGGAWIDRAVPEDGKERVVVEAYSSEHFQLLVAEPGLAPYFAFSTRLVVLYEGVVYEVRSPADPEPGGER